VLTKVTIGSISETTKAPALMKGASVADPDNFGCGSATLKAEPTLVLTKATMGSISETTNAPALMKGIFPEGDILSALDLRGRIAITKLSQQCMTGTIFL
jgi:hypothetical protein